MEGPQGEPPGFGPGGLTGIRDEYWRLRIGVTQLRLQKSTTYGKRTVVKAFRCVAAALSSAATTGATGDYASETVGGSATSAKAIAHAANPRAQL